MHVFHRYGVGSENYFLRTVVAVLCGAERLYRELLRDAISLFLLILRVVFFQCDPFLFHARKQMHLTIHRFCE